jgi:hypothetical protein
LKNLANIQYEQGYFADARQLIEKAIQLGGRYSEEYRKH